MYGMKKFMFCDTNFCLTMVVLQSFVDPLGTPFSVNIEVHVNLVL